MNTLAMMVTGIVQSKQSHLEAMARHVPDGSKVSSREKKFARFTQNEQIDEETYFMPFLALPEFMWLTKLVMYRSGKSHSCAEVAHQPIAPITTNHF